MKAFSISLSAALVAVAAFLTIRSFRGPDENDQRQDGSTAGAGEIMTTYRQVPVRSNGDDYTVSHGKHHADDGYYYGQKWQCVEFVKRFYYDAFDHRMPDVWGHAKDFFDPATPDGALNEGRGMLQFLNGGTTAPQPDDLLVFDFAPYGHVAVISAVRDHEIEVMQQNVTGRPREIHPLKKHEKGFTVESSRKPAAWLRLPKDEQNSPAATPPSAPGP